MDTKICEQCGKEFERPYTLSQKNWAKRRYCNIECHHAAVDHPRYCPVCGERFRQRYGGQATCRKRACQKEYRRTVSGPARSQRMREAYASGKRKPVTGISPREVALWPLLRESGWLWRLRWIESPQRTVEFDFALLDERLAVEIDGPEHRYPRPGRSWRTDAERDAELEQRGWQILRIPNEDVDADPEAVASRIAKWARDSRARCPTVLSPKSSSAPLRP